MRNRVTVAYFLHLLLYDHTALSDHVACMLTALVLTLAVARLSSVWKKSSEAVKRKIFTFIGKVTDWSGAVNINEGLSLYELVDQPVVMRLNNFFTYIIGCILYNNHIYTVDVWSNFLAIVHLVNLNGKKMLLS